MMSVIVKTDLGEYIMMSKGAESSIFKRLKFAGDSKK